jgi:hypothetical protein
MQHIKEGTKVMIHCHVDFQKSKTDRQYTIVNLRLL